MATRLVCRPVMCTASAIHTACPRTSLASLGPVASWDKESHIIPVEQDLVQLGDTLPLRRDLTAKKWETVTRGRCAHARQRMSCTLLCDDKVRAGTYYSVTLSSTMLT